jgi:cell wall assembly regulator SMI1
MPCDLEMTSGRTPRGARRRRVDIVGQNPLVSPIDQPESPAQAYFRWLAAHAPEVAGQLRPPADEADLAELSRLVGAQLPDEVRALYLLYDGQLDTVCLGVGYGLEFLTLQQVREEWQTWHAVRDAPDYDPDDFDRYEKVFVPGVVRKAYTTPGWVPLFRVPGRADYIGVDLNPAENGIYGQVINFGRDEPKKYAAATSLDGFFASMLAWAEAESAGADPEAVQGHIEDLFGYGGLALERFHAQASGEDVELITVDDDDDGWADAADEYQPPAELTAGYRQLLAEAHAYLTTLGRITGRARLKVSREGAVTSGGFMIWSLDGWSYAGNNEVQRAYHAVLDRAVNLGLPPQIEVRFARQDGAWTHIVREPGA